MNFSEILRKFEDLGGIANNIELREGEFGRGLFSKNPQLPVKIRVPTHLLLSPSFISLNDKNQIQIKQKSTLDPIFISFYESYHNFFGWGNCGYKEINEFHNELIALPKNLKQYLLLFGWKRTDFDKKSNKELLNDYFISRQIRIKNESRLMPIIELINHSNSGKEFIVDQGVTVEGIFQDEVLTCYHGNLDAFHFFKNYHFASNSTLVLSCDVKIDVPKLGVINISRFDSEIEVKDGIVIPKITKKNSEIQISFLDLSNGKKGSNPREIFITRMAEFNINKTTSNTIFDGLIDHNRKALSSLINECNLINSSIAKQIQLIAANQLKALN